MWRLIYAIPSWILFEAIDIPLILLGWVLIPLAAACEAYYKEFNGKEWIYHFSWKFMYIWDNYEDGIANNNYSHHTDMFRRIISWSANRNPTNNLRIIPYLTCMIDPERIGFKGSIVDSDQKTRITMPEAYSRLVNRYDTKIPQWFFCWQGLYSDFYWQFNFRSHLYRFWIGWKLYPTDIYGVTPYRIRGSGFGLQFNRVL